MTPKQIIDKYHKLRPGRMDADILYYINELEHKLARGVVRQRGTSYISRISGQAEYSLGVDFSDIEHVLINNAECPKVDTEVQTGYRKGEGNTIVLNPVPTVTDSTPGIAVVYIKDVSDHLIDDIDSDRLLLDSPDCYIYYLLAQFALETDDIQRANAYMELYNYALKEERHESYKNRPDALHSAVTYRNLW